MSPRWCFILVWLPAWLGLGVFSFTAPARAGAVLALAPEQCRAVRTALERALPISAGFRMAEEGFEDRALSLRGTRCRLMMKVTGYSIESSGEGPGLRGFGDLRTAIEEALKAKGWRDTPDLLRYMADGPTGTAFAYGRGGAVCRVSIHVESLVKGACPADEPIDLYGNCGLEPWERGYFIAVDCFRS